MPPTESLPPLPQKIDWMWTPEVHPNQTVLFRTRITRLDTRHKTRLRIAANTRYFIWINGTYAGQGPCPATKGRSLVDTYTLESCGDSACIAVIVHYYGLNTQSHSSARPGLWCELLSGTGESCARTELPAAKWRYLPQGGWIPTKCRRSWATGWAEQFDARRHPDGWERAGFDDSEWSIPENVTYPESSLAPRIVPALREWREPAVRLIAAARVSTGIPFPRDGSAPLGKAMDEEDWKLLPPEAMNELQSRWGRGDRITADPAEGGLALLFDLGKIIAGQPEFTAEGVDGCIDHCGAERLKNGRPWTFLKNADYANRWQPGDGVGTFRTLNYNGLRYLLIVLRPGAHPVHLLEAGVWRRESDLPAAVEFQSDDRELQRLWDTSIHTIEVGTQETSIDCPTREQAMYIGDGLWHSLWLTGLYNETNHFHYFMDAVAGSQDAATGLVAPAVFNGTESPTYLLDYCLIYVWGIDVYRRALPGYPDRIQAALKTGERVLKWFESRIGAHGLLEVDPRAAAHPTPGGDNHFVFIDHPGMGWHLVDEPGIARAETQQGLNAFLILAVEAFLASAEACDYTHQLNTDTLSPDRLRQQSRALFWNAETGYFADCVDQTGRHSGWSMHSQILAVLAGLVRGDEAHTLMARLIEVREDPALCKCTPYFWIYFAEALVVSGHEKKVLPLVKEAWHPMNSNPEVTTWWECFAGDELDSLCHPWAAVPAWLLHPAGQNFRLCQTESSHL